ncbi:Protein NRT1/ PTR FAMILY 8.3 [Morella rubra]|uniref:Protein NRT1/ PTR FAMILY 8.3 n=1 Tax=Morella rubra TaxID=262757 RepID=A0A6A1UZR7_9ROSI|nr:Protein NRT1/ PTR FAMILY 8.3 [Morella rubra]KAB1206085.1 Protein NRT1/ PTR FAMILY 8.3 [Morella rubra]
MASLDEGRLSLPGDDHLQIVIPSTGFGCCERLAFFGISSNLVNYLTDRLHEGNVSAAKNINNWKGACYFIPLLGGILADTFLGRYWTIGVFSTIYFLGMCTLTLSASVSALKPADCVDSVCPSATTSQYAVFFTGLYLVALGTGGVKPCIWPFGPDQFDDTDPKEKAKKGPYFNWFYFSNNVGALVASSFLVWLQDNAGWVLGFGVPSLFMGIAILSFFSGTGFYRFQKPAGSPLTRICQVFVASFHKWKLVVPTDSNLLYEAQDKRSAIKGSRKLEHSDGLEFLDKAAIISEAEKSNPDSLSSWRLCSVTQVEELKILIRKTMDKHIGSFSIPPASLSIFAIISIIIWIPIYDIVLVPIARKFTGKEKGISEVQRMGIGLVLSILSMAAAAILEMKRLHLARELGLVHKESALPISIFWQVPQYFLLVAAEVFTFIGQHEFFYEHAPDAMRSLCSALSLLTNSLGSYVSTLLLTIVTSYTTKGGKPGWIPNNLNEGHMDYFFWLLAGLSFLNLLVYIVCAKIYKEKKTS